MQRVEERQAAPTQPQPNPVLLPRRILRRGEPRLPPPNQAESDSDGSEVERNPAVDNDLTSIKMRILHSKVRIMQKSSLNGKGKLNRSLNAITIQRKRSLF